MFRSTGGVLGTAVIVLILSHQEDKAVGLQHIFIGLAVMALMVIPVVMMIPERGQLVALVCRVGVGGHDPGEVGREEAIELLERLALGVAGQIGRVEVAHEGFR
mgnify:CR=1 FL=1